MRLLTTTALLLFTSLAGATEIRTFADAKWEGPLASAIDPQTGQRVLEYAEVTPQGKALFFTEFDNPGLDRFDALEFPWKLANADANITVTLEGYPEGKLRRYYLRKRPNPVGRWQRAVLNLRSDDDGMHFAPDQPLPPGKLRLKVEVSLHDLVGLADPRLVFRMGEARLIRYPVRVASDYTRVTTFHENGRVGQLYPVTVSNQTDQPQTVHLQAEAATLKEFSLTLPPQPLKLPPNGSVTVEARLSIPETKAAELPPLYRESTSLFAWCESAPEIVVPWAESYFLNQLIGATPPPERKAPWFATPEERERALEKVATEPKAKELVERMEKLTARSMEWKEVPLPPLRHGYSGAYVCREHSSKLDYRKSGEHWCVQGKHLVTGDDAVDRGGDYDEHARLTKLALTLARLGWLTERKDYSRKAAEILLAYARVYPSFDQRHQGSTGFYSRISFAILGESWWFDPLPHALDLIRGSGVLTPEEDRQIIDHLILPAITDICRHRVNANMQAEFNHSVGVGALVARHWPLAAEALSGEFGILEQWKNDFDTDGMTQERELPYHFAAIKPFAQMAQAYEAAGIPTFNLRFKQLFDAPIATTANQIVPGYNSLYETALALWQDPAHARQVQVARTQRWGWEALLSPVTPKEEIATASIGNSTLPAGGYTTLRAPLKGSDEPLAVLINYGSPAWRDGAALLDPLILWRGLPLSQRVLRIGYGYEGSGFSHTPAAGNSLLVDGKGGSMLRATEEALLDPPYAAGRWTSPLQRPHFPGVRWSRSVALCGDSVVVLDQMESDTPRRFDLISYLPEAVRTADEASWSDYPQLKDEGAGYSQLRQPRITSDHPTRWVYQPGPKGKGMSASLQALGPAEATILAESQAEWHPRIVPVIIRRQTATTGWSALLYTGAPGDDVPKVGFRQLGVTHAGREIPPCEALAVEVKHPDGRYLILTAPHALDYEVEGQVLKGPLAVTRLSD